MKYGFLPLTLSLMVSTTAAASDKFESDIVCTKISESGSADNGLEILIQSNPTAWVKRAAVIEIGYMGRREIGHFNIPLNQPIVSTPSFFDKTRVARFEAEGFSLEIAVADAAATAVLGPATASIELPEYGPLQVNLACKSAQ